MLTNTMLTGPYRGAGRPEAAYVIETMVDLAARELGIDPRRAAPAQHDPGARRCPTRPALIYTYDCGDFGKNLEDCLILADYAGFPARRAEVAPARQAARHRRVEHGRGLERRA